MATPIDNNVPYKEDPMDLSNLTSGPNAEDPLGSATPEPPYTKTPDPLKAEKVDSDTIHQVPAMEDLECADTTKEATLDHPASLDDVLTRTIHLDDDPSLPSITIRSVFLGVGFSVFGGVLSGIYYFKPQTVTLTPVLLAILSYIVGEAMATMIPRKGRIGMLLNPHPFNVKEHLAVTIMANAASTSALGIEIISAERLYYNKRLGGAVSIFLLLSSQLLGYGIAGLMRRTLIYPKKMLWPSNIPVNAMFETLHRRTSDTRKSLRVFMYVFAGIFLWEIIPQWICPILTGVSIFCLANQHSTTFTYLFGGTNGNEGLGLFSLCFDWQYISGGTSPLYFPLSSLISQGLGICGCIVVFSAVFYSNTWDAKSYPFLGQVILSNTSTPGNATQWNQTAAINSDGHINHTAVAELGLPVFPASNVLNLILTNLTIAAGLTHVFLWMPKETGRALSFLDPRRLRHIHRLPQAIRNSIQQVNKHDEYKDDYDPHFVLSLAYNACPDWWYGLVLLLSVVIGLILIYVSDSSLPWWGFFISIAMGYVLIITLGILHASTGVSFTIQSVVQMVGGYIHRGSPVANMYFSLYGYNALGQGVLLSQDLKLAQYGHLAPRVAFAAQVLGTIIGAVFNYIMANSIIDNQREILLSIEGTNIWSGNQVQQFNAQAVTFGGFPHELFSVGGQYQWVTLIMLPGFLAPVPLWLAHKKWPQLHLDKVNTAVVAFYICYLNVGINSSVMMFFILGFGSQWWIRRRYPNLFVKYNYLVSAALDAGTSVIVFILSFAVSGAAGDSVNFPRYWGNNLDGNYDRCKYAD
ncbi:hypothetical protein RBB50_001653 [Rhinocladiella similis]